MRTEALRTVGSVVAVVTVLLLSSGCRYYGRYGGEEKTVAKIVEINEAFARAYDRAVGERDAFSGAAARRPELASYANQYGAIVERHGRLVDAHARAAQNLRGGLFGYTAANQLLGAIVSEQESVRNAYAEIVRGASRQLEATGSDEPRDASNYGQVPPYYERIRFRAVQPTLDDILRSAS